MLQLDNLLVLCLSYGSPGLQTVQMLLDLRDAGATVRIVRGPADVCVARCIQAAAAEVCLAAIPTYEYILFLDNDVWSSAESIAKMIQASRDLALQLGGVEPSLSGLYLNRHKRNKTAAAQMRRGSKQLPCVLEGSAELTTVAVHAMTGLGAFLMPTDAFEAHCSESARMYWPDRQHTIPIVCNSHPIEAKELAQYVDGIDGEGRALFWQGEDFDFCVREFKAGRNVLVAPVLFRHTTTYELDPIGSVTFPGLFAPSDELQTLGPTPKSTT